MTANRPPKPRSEEEFHFVWSMMQEFGLTERHFNEMESRYRALASTWLLATFAGIGYVAAHGHLGVKLNLWIVIAIIGLAGALGIGLLWNLDLLVYHQLLDVSFEEARKLEEIYKWLPPTRTRMIELMPGSGVLRRVVLFYIAGVDVLLSIVGIALAFWAAPFSLWISSGIAVLAIAVLPLTRPWLSRNPS